MTKEQIEAIRKRAEATTEGEWTNFDDVLCEYVNEVYEYDRLTEGIGERIAVCSTIKDADFIANAREDIPALLAEVERLRTIIDDLLYDMTNEDCTDQFVINQIHAELIEKLLGGDTH
ncbi:hypothetical protein I2483_13895 [Sporosarcina sp. E16_3]|uniref:hypothetical protein n=1 Tax=Sporosarcina sp. E16_3 TaxID=2789293 RepID=UPI001A92B26D|nr:hypothetical protein [Sporosarcina sp. E16_3]MBO0602756.1 hypothetical protein [Sporosarcina sp. E16_3]